MVTLLIDILSPVMAFQVPPPSTLYIMVLSTLLSLPPFSLSAAKVAVGVSSLVFAVALASVIVVFAVGVPETLIFVESRRVTTTPLTDVTE